MPLDISQLTRAVERLREGLVRHQREPLDEQLRDGLIQRFEYTYELCHRLLRRFLREAAASPEEVDRMAFQDLIRTANQQALLLGDWPVWHPYRDLRARSSDTCQSDTDQQAVAAIPAFLQEAEYLHEQMRRRLA